MPASARAAVGPPATLRVPRPVLSPVLSIDRLLDQAYECRVRVGVGSSTRHPFRPRDAWARAQMVAVVGLLVAVVRGRFTPHMSGGLHLLECRKGMSVNGYRPPAGAPCSRACATAQVALRLGLACLPRAMRA